MSAAEGPQDEITSSPSQAPESLESHLDLQRLRIYKLQNRLLLLQKIQQVTRRAEELEDNTPDTAVGDEGVSELDLVERELEDLLQQEQNLLNQKDRTNSNEALGGLSPVLKPETPEGGVYTLPPLFVSPDVPPQPPEDTAPSCDPPEESATPEPPQPEKQEPLKEEEKEEDEETKQIEPVNSLTQTEAFTQCPTCHKVVLTQIRKFNGDSAWLMCCVCSLLGGIVGFCFIPFCLDQTKSVRHTCPDCQATIYTYHPF